jgi:threonine aldolase
MLDRQPVTSCISLENTLGGSVMPLSDIADISQMARAHGVAMHLDGAVRGPT